MSLTRRNIFIPKPQFHGEHIIFATKHRIFLNLGTKFGSGTLFHLSWRRPSTRAEKTVSSGLHGRIPNSLVNSQKASGTLRFSRAVPQLTTDRALRRLTSEFGRDPVYSSRYGRWRKYYLKIIDNPKF